MFFFEKLQQDIYSEREREREREIQHTKKQKDLVE
jgi:hypothetical protein